MNSCLVINIIMVQLLLQPSQAIFDDASLVAITAVVGEDRHLKSI